MRCTMIAFVRSLSTHCTCTCTCGVLSNVMTALRHHLTSSLPFFFLPTHCTCTCTCCVLYGFFFVDRGNTFTYHHSASLGARVCDGRCAGLNAVLRQRCEHWSPVLAYGVSQIRSHDETKRCAQSVATR